jgi:hypothetical protein
MPDKKQPKKKVVGRPFKRGHDPRRHRPTPEECRRGYDALMVRLREQVQRDLQGGPPATNTH